MSSRRKSQFTAILVLAATVLGCAAPSSQVKPAPATAENRTAQQPPLYALPPAVSPSAASFRPVSYITEGEAAELSVEQLVAEVEARNPSLQAAVAAWNAASQRYPQQVSLDDPMFTYMISPGVGRDGDGSGWMAQVSQHVPWPGRRALRGSAATAEADAMRGELGDTRLRLAEAAEMAFYDYYLAFRLSDVNETNRKLLAEFRQLARTRYETGQGIQQDVLQSDVELAGLEARATELARDRHIAAARINTLLRQLPDSPLPRPPERLVVPEALPAVEGIQEAAAGSRPDLYALHARIRAEEANLALARKNYYPDIDVMAKYDTFMPDDIRPAVGMQINVPLDNARRSAAVNEAEARVQQRRWEYQNLLDEVRFEVQSAHAQAEQAGQVVSLYRDKILPASRRNVESAQANYTSGKLDFLRLIDAQRQLNAQQEMYYRAIAEYHRRLAELDRAAGAIAR